MRILHCADIHLDSRMNSNLEGHKINERRAELVMSFKHMIDFAVSENADAVIIAGDLFDTDIVSNATIRAVLHCIEANPQMDFYYLRGNHDSFDVIGDSGLSNLKIFGEDWTYYKAGEKYPVVICGASAPTQLLELERNAFNIVVLHGQIYENTNSEGIDLAGFRNKSIDYMALGHVHRYISGKLDERGKYCYPGCLESRGFDECDSHGVVMLEIDDFGGVKDTFIPWGKRKAYKAEVDISECLDSYEAIKTVEEHFDNMGILQSDMVEVVLSGKMYEAAAVSIDVIAQELKDRYYCVKVKDNTAVRININDYANEISLKSEFIRCVMSDSMMSPEEKDEIIKTGLWALKEL